MTKLELNRDIKRLRILFKIIYGNNASETSHRELQDEFMRLYRADNTAESLSANSLRTMMRINQANRYVPLHTFYIQIEL